MILFSKDERNCWSTSRRRKTNKSGGKDYSQENIQYGSSRRGYSNENSQHGGCRFSRGRGGGRMMFRDNRVICQLCGKIGHVAIKCFKRFDVHFTGVNSSPPQSLSNWCKLHWSISGTQLLWTSIWSKLVYW